MLEIVFAVAVLLIFGVPVLNCLETTTRGVAVSQDHLIAQNLALMLYEHAAFFGNTDDTTSFERLAENFQVSPTETSPDNGCAGAPVSTISTSDDGILIPDCGDERFDLTGDGSAFGNLYRKFSYSLQVTQSTDDAVIVTGSEAALYRIDIKVYWRGSDRRVRCYPLSNLLAKRKY